MGIWEQRPSAGLALAVAACALAAQGCERKVEERRRAELRALPYMATTPVAEADRGKRGVTIFDPDRAAPGVNVYCSEENHWFELRSMRGETLHRVDLPGWCKLVKPHGSDFLVLHGEPPRLEVESLSRIDLDGTVRWTNEGPFHHDFDVVDDQRVLVLDTAESEIEHRGKRLPFLDNGIVTVDLTTGRTLRRRSLRGALGPHVGSDALDRLAEAHERGEPTAQGDLFHVNTVDMLSVETSIGRAGDILLAARHLDLIGVLDQDSDALTWVWTNELEGPHQPQLRDSGNVLVFDNGRQRGWSRIAEIDPETESIVWSYEDRDDPRFFSATRGSVQVLPNDNLLIAEADRGRWFELTRDKETVWEYWTEDAADESTDGTFMRSTTYRTRRLFEDDIASDRFASLWADAAAAAD